MVWLSHLALVSVPEKATSAPQKSAMPISRALRSAGPASSRATETAGSSLSRLASTEPALPPPTMT